MLKIYVQMLYFGGTYKKPETINNNNCVSFRLEVHSNFIQFFKYFEDPDHHWEAGESKQKSKIATN